MTDTIDNNKYIEADLKEDSIPHKYFYIFGLGISFSMSPTIHLAGFRHYDLPHTYEIRQTETVDELDPFIYSPSFGGASVTMPHKIEIGKFCSAVTEDARLIGAINTLIPEDAINSRRKGDNTDWSGLVEVLRQKSKNLSNAPDCGLVIGAGGASRAAIYAMHKVGLKTIYLYNRTRSRAEAIAVDFAPIFEVIVLEGLEDFSRDESTAPDVIIGTIPADKTTVDSFPLSIFTKSYGICVDMSYKPRHTPLLEAAMRAGQNWSTVTGIEVLFEQAFEQFRLWTGREAPEEVMRQALAARDKERITENNREGDQNVGIEMHEGGIFVKGLGDIKLEMLQTYI